MIDSNTKIDEKCQNGLAFDNRQSRNTRRTRGGDKRDAAMSAEERRVGDIFGGAQNSAVSDKNKRNAPVAKSFANT